jgi:hypothetical protein
MIFYCNLNTEFIFDKQLYKNVVAIIFKSYKEGSDIEIIRHKTTLGLVDQNYLN